MDSETNTPIELPTSTHVTMIVSVLKRQINNMLDGSKCEFEPELRKIVSDIYEAGYSKGLRDMDIMHGNIDKKEVWQKDTD